MINTLHFKLNKPLIVSLTPLTQAGSSALLDLLPTVLKARLISLANEVKYVDGQLIHSRGANEAGISIIKSGAANIGVYGADGTFVMAGVLGAGEAFGEFTLFTDLPRTHDVSACGITEVYQISGARFLSLCDQEPTLLKALLKSTLVRTHILLELLDAMRRLPLLERSAKLILSMSYTAGTRDHIQIKQNDLALSLGVTRVSLGKALRQLRELGLIEIGYGKIGLPNRENLEQWLEARSDTPLKSKH